MPDELIKHYPEPPEKLQTILQHISGTGIILYQYIMHYGITKEAKYWAIDMMDGGFDTPGIVQLAGEDLNMNPFAYADLLDTIFRELDIKIEQKVAYCAYAVSIADEVLQRNRTARNGFELLHRAAIDTDYNDIFWTFYIWLENADCTVYYDVGGGLRMDNIEEWMHLFFEKFAKANYKYSSVISSTPL